MKSKILSKTLFLSTVFTLSSCQIFTSSNVSRTDVEISSISFGFIEKTSAVTDFSKYAMIDTFYIASQYYLIFEFSFTARENNSGQSSVVTIVEFPDMSCFDASVYLVNSGSSPTPISTTDQSGNPIKQIFTTLAVPEKADGVYVNRMVFGITPIKVNSTGSALTLNFNSNTSSLSGPGRAGQTVTVAISPVQIAQPSLSRNGTQIKWGHVEHADYHKIFYGNSDTPLKKEDGTDYRYYPPEGTSPNSPLYFNSWADFGVTGSSVPVRVRAYSDTPSSYLTSAPSETVFIPAL